MRCDVLWLSKACSLMAHLHMNDPRCLYPKQYNAGQNSNGQIDSKGMYITNIGGNLAMGAQCWDTTDGSSQKQATVNCAVKSYSRNVSSICLYDVDFTHLLQMYGKHDVLSSSLQLMCRLECWNSYLPSTQRRQAS